MGTTLFIPVARSTDGRIYHAHEGAKGRAFFCPGCNASVVWRKCDEVNRRSHFAHEPGAPCTESAIHFAAKYMVAQQINDYREGLGRNPCFTMACRDCGKACEPIPFSPKANARVEVRLDCGLQPDVLVGDTLAIEIFHTHAIGKEKIDVLKKEGIQWVEIGAADVLKDPSRWSVNRSTREGKPLCFECAKPFDRATLADETYALIQKQQSLAVVETRLGRREEELNLLKASLDKERFSAEVQERHRELNELRTTLASERTKILGSADKELAEVQARIDALKYTESAVLMLKIRNAEITYSEIFNATEQLRLKAKNHLREIGPVEDKSVARYRQTIEHLT